MQQQFLIEKKITLLFVEFHFKRVCLKSGLKYCVEPESDHQKNNKQTKNQYLNHFIFLLLNKYSLSLDVHICSSLFATLATWAAGQVAS